ncbi:hypothetical protein Mapa_000119 [Marchantia paleacea]|nr:hypothetical protein Mapa_000119 [Marchantia paleacea]
MWRGWEMVDQLLGSKSGAKTDREMTRLVVAPKSPQSTRDPKPQKSVVACAAAGPENGHEECEIDECGGRDLSKACKYAQIRTLSRAMATAPDKQRSGQSSRDLDSEKSISRTAIQHFNVRPTTMTPSIVSHPSPCRTIAFHPTIGMKIKIAFPSVLPKFTSFTMRPTRSSFEVRVRQADA